MKRMAQETKKKSSLRKLFGKKDKKESNSEIPDQATPPRQEIPGRQGRG